MHITDCLLFDNGFLHIFPTMFTTFPTVCDFPRENFVIVILIEFTVLESEVVECGCCSHNNHSYYSGCCESELFSIDLIESDSTICFIMQLIGATNECSRVFACICACDTNIQNIAGKTQGEKGKRTSLNKFRLIHRFGDN